MSGGAIQVICPLLAAGQNQEHPDRLRLSSCLEEERYESHGNLPDGCHRFSTTASRCGMLDPGHGCFSIILAKRLFKARRLQFQQQKHNVKWMACVGIMKCACVRRMPQVGVTVQIPPTYIYICSSCRLPCVAAGFQTDVVSLAAALNGSISRQSGSWHNCADCHS